MQHQFHNDKNAWTRCRQQRLLRHARTHSLFKTVSFEKIKHSENSIRRGNSSKRERNEGKKWKVNRMALVCSSLMISLHRQNGNSMCIFNAKWRNLIWPEAKKIEFTQQKLRHNKMIFWRACVFDFSLRKIYFFNLLWKSSKNGSVVIKHDCWAYDQRTVR